MFLMRMMLELFGRLKMIEIIFTVLVIGAILLGVAMFINMKREISKRLNVESNVIEPKNLAEPEIEKSKLQQVIEEAKAERKLIEENFKKERYVLVQKEKERLLENEMIYNAIKESILNGKDCVEIECSDYWITRTAVYLIPELKLMPIIIGNGFNFDDKKSITIYF